MAEHIGGYEWGFECRECEHFNGLSGMGFGSHPKVNGETAVRCRGVEDGDTLECGECGHEFTVRFDHE